MPSHIPLATYRLQFNAAFDFARATELVPYLHRLGISHVYASPLLKARSGSHHGYDIVDHNTLNPELGSEADFARFVDTLRQHDMGLLLDIVPNHMGVGGCDNKWWLDVLEHGEASMYADYFDIDWHPLNPVLHNKLSLPFLGDHYGNVLESGELRLIFDQANGAFHVAYYDHCFPIDPRTYDLILTYHLAELEVDANLAAEAFATLQTLIKAFSTLPHRTNVSMPSRERRQRDTAEYKQRLSQLCRSFPTIAVHLQQSVARLNGVAGQSRSFDSLHRLLEQQAYRLAYWKVSTDEINYRRFLDINELAALRMQAGDVFSQTHSLIAKLANNDMLGGVRVDHVDGLCDPLSYCLSLRKLLDRENGSNGRLYLIIEKILADNERLDTHWPVEGTTGYEFAALVNGWFVDPQGERALMRLYTQFTNPQSERPAPSYSNLNEQIYRSKKFIIYRTLSSELSVLANLLSRIAQADRHTRDFTFQSLREALAEVIASFSVYRTYIAPWKSTEQDRAYVRWAITQGKKHSPGEELIFDFIHNTLIPEYRSATSPGLHRRIVHFRERFQQYSATVSVKGMEDTAHYRHCYLASLNDVGFDPRRFSISTATLHDENQRRCEEWPHGLVSTSTHDSKRGEDVRMRIDVLSEVSSEWRQRVGRWYRLNSHRKRLRNDVSVPCRNEEYLLYQTLVGSWPVEAMSEQLLGGYRHRIKAYMCKAAREAKRYTSWKNPDAEYEQALSDFIDNILSEHEHNDFLKDFVPFQQRIARFGLYNSLSQTLLKLTVPGVPDIYQGNEIWAFNLVDPDNRRPVDYEQRQSLLQTLQLQAETATSSAGFARQLIGDIADGRAKMYVCWKTLTTRRQHAAVFSAGRYMALVIDGERSEHLCAFARDDANQNIIVITTRWFARLLAKDEGPPLGATPWRNTSIVLPHNFTTASYHNVFTEETITVNKSENRRYIDASEVLANFPLALLCSITEPERI